MGLIIPGLTPDTLGEIYEYYPTLTELRVAAGIFAVGFLIFTLMLKVAVPIALGEFRLDDQMRGRVLERLAPIRGPDGGHQDARRGARGLPPMPNQAEGSSPG